MFSLLDTPRQKTVLTVLLVFCIYNQAIARGAVISIPPHVLVLSLNFLSKIPKNLTDEPSSQHSHQKNKEKTLHFNLMDAPSWIFNKPYSVLENQTLI